MNSKTHIAEGPPQRLRMLQFACTPRRRAKAALFALSPELFRRVMIIDPLTRKGRRAWRNMQE